MEKIVKKDGYVYLVYGTDGFLTWRNMGKDPDDPMWNEEIVEKPKRKKTKKEED